MIPHSTRSIQIVLRTQRRIKEVVSFVNMVASSACGLCLLTHPCGHVLNFLIPKAGKADIQKLLVTSVKEPQAEFHQIHFFKESGIGIIVLFSFHLWRLETAKRKIFRLYSGLPSQFFPFETDKGPRHLFARPQAKADLTQLGKGTAEEIFNV